jgi:hypothetical protein
MSAKTKKMPQPKFEIGKIVWVAKENKALEIIEARWNGFTFMYSFKGTTLRCGEMYLRKIG